MVWTKFLAPFAETVKDNIVEALSPIAQLTAKAQVGQPSRQAVKVLLRHCVIAKAAHLSRLLPPSVMRDLASSADEPVARSCARINSISVEDLGQRAEQLSLPIPEGGM